MVGEGISGDDKLYSGPATYYSHAKQSFYSNMQASAQQYARAPQTPNEPMIYANAADNLLTPSGGLAGM